MPQIDQPTLEPFTTYLPPLEPEPPTPPTPSLSETVGAAVRQYNDIYAMYNLATKTNPRYAPTPPGFVWENSLKSRGLWDQADSYIGAHSDPEIDFRTAQIAKENQDRDTLTRAGWPGYAAMVASGAVSLTSFIPLLRGATGVRSFIKSAVAIGAGQAVQEAVLFQNQQTRTGEEAAFSIGAGTLLGGLLGTAAHWMHPADFAKAAHDMANVPGTLPIPETVPGQPGSVGASAINPEINNAGRFAGNRVVQAINKRAAFMSPIDRGIEQANAPLFMKEGSPTLRSATAAFGQAGRTLEKNIEGVAAAPGGNIESLVKTWQIGLHKTQIAFEDAYKAYMYEGNAPKVLGGMQAKIKGYFDKSKMDFPEFKKQGTLAYWSDFDPSFNPHVIAAAKSMEKHFNDLYQEGIRQGVFTGEEKVIGDKKYLSHVWDLNKVVSNEFRLKKDLMDHFGAKLQVQFQDGITKLNKKSGIDKTFLKDNVRSESEIAQLIAQHEEDLAKLEETAPPEVTSANDLRDRAATALAQAQELRDTFKRATGSEQPALMRAHLDLMDQHKELKRQAALAADNENVAKYHEEHAALARRLRGLSQAKVVMTRRFEAKLRKIDRAEELQSNIMLRAGKAAHKLLTFFDQGSPKEIEAALSKFKTEFAQEAVHFDKNEEKIVKLTETQDEGDLPGVIARQEIRNQKMTDLADHIASLDEHDPIAFRTEVEDAIKWMQEERVAQMERRTLRTQRLREQAMKLSPEEQAKRLDELKTKAARRPTDFAESWRSRGADAVDLLKGTADFTKYLKDTAETVLDKIKGSARRLAYSDLIQEKRGPELARMLDIPGEKVAYALETDPEKIMSDYTRTIAADVTLASKFGKADMSPIIDKLNEEQHAAVDRIETLTDKAGKPLDEAAKEKLRHETQAFYTAGKEDLYTLFERVRGHRGIAADPKSWATRAGKAALAINNARFLGSVIFMQLNDISSPIMRAGLLHSFRDGFVPFVTNLKQFYKINKKLALEANATISAELHTRMHTINDMWDDPYRGTIAERGLNYISNKVGFATGFDKWTETAKVIATGINNARIMRSIETILTGKGSAKEIAHSQEFLAKVNIDAPIAERIWQEMTSPEGGNKVDGIWQPNTDAWNVADDAGRIAKRGYLAALTQEMEDMVMTPGLEKPSMSDANIMGKLLFQFRNFGASSTQKILLAGLQEHDARFLNGVMISLALGALSYYLYALSAGGKVEERMQKALDEGDYLLFADEAIARVNFTGWGNEAQRVAQRIPVLRDYASFKGGQTKRYGGDLMAETLGPTGDLLDKIYGIMTGVAPVLKGDPITQHTYHLARQVIPFENHLLLRRLFDAVGNAFYSYFNVPQRSAKQ